MKCMSVSIRVENTLKTQIYQAQDLIQRKFGVQFQKQNQVFPHINLISGKVADVGKVYSLLDSISVPNSKMISPIGLGCFLTPSPTIFVRYELTKNVSFIRSQLFKETNFWNSIDYTVKKEFWLPKTTLACKDIKLFNFSDICAELLLLDFSSNFKLEALVVLEYSDNQAEMLCKKRTVSFA